MKRITILSLLALSLLALSSCHKPSNGDDPAPTTASEITSENAAPGGFSDEGPSNWDE